LPWSSELQSSKLYPFPLYSANIFSSSRLANGKIKITTLKSKFPVVRFSLAQYSFFFASLLLKRPRLETLKLVVLSREVTIMILL